MSERVVSPVVYSVVFVALVLLTLLTVTVSTFELGHWHTPAGLAIAVAKALLVFLFFMHVIYSGRVTWIVVLSMLFWLGILMVLTLSDYLSRGAILPQ